MPGFKLRESRTVHSSQSGQIGKAQPFFFAGGFQLLDQVCQLVESYQALVMARDQLRPFLLYLLADLAILRGFFRSNAAIAGDPLKGHRLYLST